MRDTIILALAIALAFCGCDQKPALPTNSAPKWEETTPLPPPVVIVEKIEKLEKDLQSLRGRVLDLEMQRYAFHSINLTPEQKGFQRLDAGFVTLLVTTDSIDPYLDGFKIKLKVGNPTSGDLSAAQLVCTTYKPSASTNATPPWENWRSITNSVSAKLFAGTWTPIEFILAPATINELRNASVTLEVNEVFLREPSHRNR